MLMMMNVYYEVKLITFGGQGFCNSYKTLTIMDRKEDAEQFVKEYEETHKLFWSKLDIQEHIEHIK